MAEVMNNVYLPMSGRPRTSLYFPTIPRTIPKNSISYVKSINDAPHTALMGVIVNGKHPERHVVTPRCRVRKQVGGTNRWRLPESLGSDLLGSRQAIKSTNVTYNTNMINILTAETPQSCLHLDSEKPYTFNQTTDRTNTDFFSPRSNRRKELDNVSSVTSKNKRSNLTTTCPVQKCIPTIPVTPKDILLYHSQKSMRFIDPDVVLTCLGIDWELHRPYLKKAQVLSQLLQSADRPKMQKYYRNSASKTLDTYIKKNNVYSNEYKDISNRLSIDELVEDKLEKKDNLSQFSEKSVYSLATIKLDVRDPLLTKRGMAVALGSLYCDDIFVSLDEVTQVMTAAACIGYQPLVDECTKMMLMNITCMTVCRYYNVCSKIRQIEVVKACERWLELNLLKELNNQIQIREISLDLLQKILKSDRLFVPTEYSIYKTLSIWLFLVLNPGIQLMPSHCTVLSYFNSLPKGGSFLERGDGKIYAPLFSIVRLQGITDTNQIKDMQLMNILPQYDLMNLLTHHYQSLQGGGDMAIFTHFNTDSIRHGFVIDDEPFHHSEVLSLFGFHFELKAAKNAVGQISIFMQRLKPGDPILSVRQNEKHTFSIRSDRKVRYRILAQGSREDCEKSTGIITQQFGVGEKTSRSEVLQIDKIYLPLYVNFFVLFPAS